MSDVFRRRAARLVILAGTAVSLAISSDVAAAQCNPFSPQPGCAASTAMQPRITADFGVPKQSAKPAQKPRVSQEPVRDVSAHSTPPQPIDCRMPIVPHENKTDRKLLITPSASTQHHLRIVTPPQCPAR